MAMINTIIRLKAVFVGHIQNLMRKKRIRHRGITAFSLIMLLGLTASACSSSSSTTSLSPSERSVAMAWVSSGSVFIVAGGATQPTQVSFPTYAVPVPSDVAVSASGNYATFITPQASGPGKVTWVYNSTTRNLQEVKCGSLACGTPGFAGDVFLGEILKSNGLASHLVLLPPGDQKPIRIPLTGYPKEVPGSPQEFLAATSKTKAQVIGVSQVGAIQSVPMKNSAGALDGHYALFLLKTDGAVQPFGVVDEEPQYNISQPNSPFAAVLLGKGATQKVEVVNVDTGKIMEIAGGLAGLKIQTIFSANKNWYVAGTPDFACSICSGTKSGHEVLLELHNKKWKFIHSATIDDGPFVVNFSGTSGNALIKSGKLETVAPLTDVSFSS